ncbi:MAG TPA: DUF6528 family protein [Stackebrandtia sp.]|jgi:hypothetical protein|uniref:DUF6528 family protein n=1 Tax=Stackebrandtia sp. TaxID=2023065 RepID=UPI002D3EC330|nr:DUF6528 family protein [Stackebrandtia sp.]HZE37330.1 DUF6528 family protein [Stackebrandtia sp.]
MNRRTLLRGAAIGAVATPLAIAAGSAMADSARAADYQIAGTDQAGARIVVFNRNDNWSESTIKWSWHSGSSGWSNLSDVKFRATASFGTVAIAVASGGNAGIIRQDNKQVLWTGAPGGNPHAIERIPDIGVIITASSGGYLNVYGPTAISKPSTLARVQQVSLAGAHGVLWDPTLKILWASADKQVRAYQVTGSYRDTRLKDLGKKVTLAGLGHDLQPDYSDKNKLLVTDSYGSYELDKTKLTLTQVRKQSLIKAFTRHSSGEALWVHGENIEPRPWASPTVHFDGGDKKLSGAQFYKARIVTTAFQ